jgi:dipeptidyl aminopeptidase/acylaminoacyl peptidase
MSSSSNRQALVDIKWLEDNETIAFLGENPGELRQLYVFNIRTRVLTRVTNSPTNVTRYSITPRGDQIAYLAEEPVASIVDDETRREGVLVSSQPLEKLISGVKGSASGGRDQLFFRTQAGVGRRINTLGRMGFHGPFLSPDGRYLLMGTFVPEFPQSWKEYANPRLHDLSSQSPAQIEAAKIERYELIETATGASRILLDAPVRPGWGSEASWSVDSRSIIISDTYLPLEHTRGEEREVRKSLPFVAEVKVPGGEIVKVSNEDLRLLEWDAKANRLIFVAGRLNWSLEPKVFFRKDGDHWQKVSESRAEAIRPEIVVEQDLNTPPKVYARDHNTQKRALLLDLNPQFKDLRFAKEEEIRWKASDGHEVKGGLYYPVGYVPGTKYPLVIQTHAFVSGQFWIDGPWTTAFAAQPLAGAGIMVLQMDEMDGNYDNFTPESVNNQVAVLESAIAHLDSLELIDLNRVGIIGFSATCTDVAYALTHSNYRFAAASLTDGQDGGYFVYISVPTLRPFLEKINGGVPFGRGLSRWVERSPEFNADKIETPLRIIALGPRSLLVEWELFVSLSRIGKPTELTYMPDASHVLEKPWERMVSQQGNVDWFDFWLNGHEDPDPAKADQYARWRALRDQAKVH